MKNLKIVFISGHGDITESEFKEFYIPKIVDKIEWNFIICDFKGVDTKAQNFLAEKGCKNVTVYHLFDKPRYLADSSWKTKGGFNSDLERDTACTLDSEEDILWIRPGREKSGTADNFKRRINKSWISQHE